MSWARGLVIRNTQTCDTKSIKMHAIGGGGTSNQRAKFVRLTLQMNDFAPLTRWCCKLWKGILTIVMLEHPLALFTLFTAVYLPVDFILLLTSCIPYRGFSFWLIFVILYRIHSDSLQSSVTCTVLFCVGKYTE